MKSTDDVKTFFKNAAIGTNPKMDKTVLDRLLMSHEKATNTKSAAIEPNMRRSIMKSPLTKLAAAAMMVIAVLVSMTQFGGSATSVTWGEVVKNVEASRGLIVRCTESFPSTPESLSFLNDSDYSIKYVCPTYSRTDSYKAGQITHTYYSDFSDPDTETLTHVYHIHKRYLSRTYSKSKHEFLLEQHDDWMNPRYLVRTILSCKHRKLGRKTIDGVLCEGIETTDPASMGPLPEPIDLLEVQLRLWVDAETEYPVLFESKISIEAEGQVMSSEGVMDQFQWDVELDQGLFEPNIPPGYRNMRSR